MSALNAGQAERAVKPVMRAQRHKPIRLDPTTAPQHPHDRRRLQIVITQHVKHAAVPLKRPDVPLQERLLGLLPKRHHECCPRETRPHLEQVHVDRHAAKHHPRLSPVDLGLNTGVADQRHEHLADLTQLATLGTHIPTHLPLRHLRAVLVHQPLPDPPGGMPLLARRLAIRLQNLIDDRPIPAKPRRRPRHRHPLRRRNRRRQRLPDRPPMHPVTLR